MEALFRAALAEARTREADRGDWRVAARRARLAAAHPLRMAPAMAAARPRRRARGKAIDHARFRSSLRMAGAHTRNSAAQSSSAMLALGIGANVAVFSLINGLFLKPLPFPDPDRLVYINETAPRWNLEMTGITYADFAQWQKAQQAFDAIATFNRRSFNVATDNGADRMDGASVSADFARVLGIEPVIGRMFTAEEDRPNGPTSR